MTTSWITVSSRVSFVAPRLGAVLTQHRTDPRLGPRGLALLRSGCTAAEALAASTPDHQWRQLAVLHAQGRTTAHSHGARVKPSLEAARGPDVLALGKILANDRIPAAMRDAFLAAEGERLMRGL